MRPPARIDGRLAEDFARQLRRYAPQYTPDLDLADQGVGSALVDIFARLAEAITLRLDRAPQKHFVAFLDRLGIVQLPATPARTAVTFKPASGLESPVLVPAGARVSAPGQDGEIPFETEGDLQAIPGAIQAMYGVDPAEDAVFRPPPGFPTAEPKVPTSLVYQVKSFTAAGEKRLQLDHVTDLAPGAYVRIACREKRVVLKVDEGNLVTVDPPLGRDVEADAVVTPIRDFEVFDAINLQEHALYLGDSRVLATKEAAEITLLVTLKDTGARPAPLDLAWEFWTQTDAPDDQGHWEALGLTADGTGGLSRSGTIVLAKPADREIKSRKVGPKETRWMRGRVRGKLAPGAVLPVVDSIEMGVGAAAPAAGSGGAAPAPKGIKPDQGFYNITPLDVQVPDVGFLPFGSEPRPFDQFYLASKEAFSKTGARITLDFKLDLETVATPSVVPTNLGLRAYSIGLRRRLYELDLATGTWQTLAALPAPAQGAPPLPVKDAAPSAISDGVNGVLTFVTTEQQQVGDKTYSVWVHVRDVKTQSASWSDLGSPGPYELSSPVAVRVQPPWTVFSRVFVVAGNKLWSMGVTATGTPDTMWQDHGKLGGVTTLDPRPFVVLSGPQVVVFVGSDRGVQRFVLQFNGTAAWDSLDAVATPFAVTSRPFAVSTGGTDARVFVLASTPGSPVPRLFECNTATTPPQWVDLLSPPGMAELAKGEIPSTPAGYIEDPSQPIAAEGKHIFIRGSGNTLWQRLDGSSGLPAWSDHGSQGPVEIRESPAVHVEAVAGSPTIVTVMSANTANSLVRWVFERRSDTAPGTPAGDPTAGRAVLLARSIPGAFQGLPLTVTKGGPPETQTIDAYDAVAPLARVGTPYTTVVPDQKADCEIGGASVGKARDGFDRAFVLHDVPVGGQGASASLVKIGPLWVGVESYSRPTGVVVLTSPADTVAPGDLFELFSELITGTNEFRAAGDAGAVPELSWEYWNGRGWLSLRASDSTQGLLTNGTVVINLLPPIALTEVAGQENYWIRARLVGGDYGRETFTVSTVAPTTGQVLSDKSSLHPPKVLQVLIDYQAPPVTPEACVTANNLDYLDQTAASQLAGAHFGPFQPLEPKSLALFIGLDQPFQTGPVRLLLDAAERDFEPDKRPALVWEFRKDHQWIALSSDDDSVALTRQGVLTLSASAALTRDTLFGQSLYWIRGTLRLPSGVSVADYPRPLLKGLFLNTVTALQGETVTDEIVGSSDGEPNQRYRLQRPNVLGAAEIRVQEPLSSAENQQLVRDGGPDSVIVRSDLVGTWVRWSETTAFFNCGPDDRMYSLDRADGEIRFGDGTHGRIPPGAIDNIRAFRYRTGGGTVGNVAAGTITTLATAVAGVESVLNPTPAGGGSDTTDTDQMLTIGPRQISHRGRAVSTTDFEELACEASREVAKARCLPITNLVRSGVQRRDPCDAAQRHEARPARGWVSLIIVPRSPDPLPCPSLQLRRAVADYLRDRAPGLVAGGTRIVVRPPDYVVVELTAEIRVGSLEQVAQVEREARGALETFLHPLRGGPNGTGWEFGRPLAKSDVFAVLERVRNLDRVDTLTFRYRGQRSTEAVTIGPNELIAGGKLELQIAKG